MKIAVLVILAFGVLIWACKPNPNSAYKDINVTNLDTYINDLNVQLVDVRTPKEFKQGKIAHAVNIDFWANNFEEQIQILDKNKPIVLYCKSGGRSKKASNQLSKLGFKTIYNLKGGYLAWKGK